jgi:hypothetical protein
MRIRRDKHTLSATLQAVDPDPISNKKLGSTLQIGRILCSVLRIRSRIRIKLEKGKIRIRIKVISWIRINLQKTSQNVWNMSHLSTFFKVLSLYLEARIRIRIKSER